MVQVLLVTRCFAASNAFVPHWRCKLVMQVLVVHVVLLGATLLGAGNAITFETYKPQLLPAAIKELCYRTYIKPLNTFLTLNQQFVNENLSDCLPHPLAKRGTTDLEIASAQLVVTTHDLLIMDSDLLRHDQF
jgi:hypothetical protein